MVEYLTGCITKLSAEGANPLPAGTLWDSLFQAGHKEYVAKQHRRSPVSQEAWSKEAWKRSCTRAAQIWVSIWESLTTDSGLPYEMGAEPASRVIDFLARADLHGLALKWLKETTAYIAARGFQQSETNLASLQKVVDSISLAGVECPPIGCLGWGWVRRRCKWISASRTGMSESFRDVVYHCAENVLYIKRGAPCMGDDQISAALQDHCKVLTEPRDARHSELFDRTVLAVERLVEETFSGKSLDPKETAPSINAGYGAPRASGGAFGALMEGCWKDLDRIDIPVAALWTRELIRMEELVPGVVVSVYADRFGEALLSVFSNVVSRGSYEPAGSQKPILARPSAVPEPCKCRIVTSGEPDPYQRAFQLQKFMHGILRRTELFQFVGSPITPERWPFAAEVLPLDEIYVSGDYKGATDNLDPRLSEWTWECICRFACLGDSGVPLCDTAWAALGSRCLTCHTLDYTRCFPEGGKCAQTWGQLMGSPMSFPILNLVNAAATAVGLGWSAGSVTRFLLDHGCRTNGDDICFKCKLEQYPSWQSAVRSVGLEPSLGKNYTSRDFVIMNSEMRIVSTLPGPVREGEGRLQGWVLHKFLNLPLLFGMDAKGQHAGTSVLSSTPWYSIRPNIVALVSGVAEDVAARRLNRALLYYDQVLRRVPAGVSYTIPAGLGGLGLPCIGHLAEPRYQPQEGNLQRAAWLACLDAAKRAKALTPPKVDGTDLVSHLLSSGSETLATRTKLVVPCEDFGHTAVHNRGSVDVLVSCLRNWYLDQNCRDMWLQAREQDGKTNFAVRDRKVVMSGDPNSLEAREGRRVELEKRFNQLVGDQNRRARQSSLEPMSLWSVWGWSQPYYLVEEEIQTRLETRITDPYFGRRYYVQDDAQVDTAEPEESGWSS